MSWAIVEHDDASVSQIMGDVGVNRIDGGDADENEHCREGTNDGDSDTHHDHDVGDDDGDDGEYEDDGKKCW